MPRGFRPGLAISAVALALLLSFSALALFGKNPAEAFSAMLRGGFGSADALGESLIKAAILTLTALAVALPFATGLFNIGGQGQLLVGAIAAAFLGRALNLPAALELPACLLGAALGGGLWGLLAGWLKTARGVHEVISTILLNWIAMHLIENGLVVGPLAARSTDASVSLPGTALIRDSASLPLLWSGTRLHLGVPLAFAVALALAWLMTRTTWGFELRTVGASPEAARSAGISVARRQLESMLVGAACAGLAGALLVLGTEGRYPPHISTPYGFDGIAVAFIGGNSALGSAVAALFFGTIRAGGTRLQLLGIHRDFPELIQGLALLLVSGRAVLGWVFARLRPERNLEVHGA
jgi:general nucleoside transport system permease protein